MLNLSPYGRLFSPFKSFSATFFTMLGIFCYVFFHMRSYFHYLKALLLRFSPFGGPFSPFKSLSATFFSLCGGLFATFFLWGGGGGFFPPFEGLSATFFLHVGVLFLFLWGPFSACPPPPTKISAGAHACVSLKRLTPMSNMQHSHSLTASCHFRDILKVVIMYFLIYIFAWLTTFKIRKRNENNIF